MTSFFAIVCTIALALPVVLGAGNEQRVQVTPKKEGTNETCPVSTLYSLSNESQASFSF